MNSAADHPRQDRVDELIADWERLVSLERDCELDELCRDDSDCLDAVVSGVRRLQRIARFIQPDENERAALMDSGPPKISGYEIIEEIARGGSGVVYRGVQSDVGREVAIKIIRVGDRPERALARYERETHALSRINHKHIAAVYDAGVAQNGLVSMPYIVMELIDGVPLDLWVMKREPTQEERLHLFLEICEGIAAAHTQGVIHRDLKPSNILISSDGHAKICDFGIARIQHPDADTMEHMTHSSEIVGTVQYMSPEHVLGSTQLVDTRSDVYCLGLILYEMLTGETALDVSDRTIYEAIEIIGNERPPIPRWMGRPIPRDLSTIVMRTLEKNPADRYQSVDALSQDITHYIRAEPISMRPVNAFEALWRWTRRNKLPAASLGCAIVALIAGFTVSTYFLFKSRDAELNARTSARDALQAAEDAGRKGEIIRQSEQNAIALKNAAEAANADLKRNTANMLLGRIQTLTTSDRQLASDWLHDESRIPMSSRNFAWHWLKKQTDTLRLVVPACATGNDHVAFNSDGTRLLSTGQDSRVKVWDSITGSVIADVPGLSPELPVAFAPNAETAVICGPEGSALLMNFDLREPTGHFTGDGNTVRVAAYSPDGSLIALGLSGGRVQVVSVADRSVVADFQMSSARTAFVAFTDELLVAVNAQGVTTEWNRADWSKRSERRLTHSGTITRVALSHPWIAMGGRNGIIDVHNLNTGLWRQFNCRTQIHDLEFGPAGTRLYAAARNRIRIWEHASGHAAGVLRHSNSQVRDIAVTRCDDADFLAIASSNRDIEIHQLQTSSLDSLNFDDNANAVVFLDKGKTMAVSERSGLIRLLDTKSLKELSRRKLEFQTSSLVRSPDGSTLAASTHSGGIVLLNATDLSIAGKIPLELKLSRIAWSPAGNLIAAADRRGGVLLWDALTLKSTQTLRVASEGALGLEFSPDGKLLATVDSDGDLFLWDSRHGRRIAERRVSRHSARACCFTPDGRYVFTGEATRIHKWSVPELELIDELQGHHDPVTALSVSPDGTTLASGSRDYRVILWDADSGDIQIALDQHTNYISSLKFAPDSSTLSTTAIGWPSLLVWRTLPSAAAR